jgi:hypothetical protein
MQMQLGRRLAQNVAVPFDQLLTLTAQNILRTHPPYPLVNACPVHPKPPVQEVQTAGYLTSHNKARPNHEPGHSRWSEL